MVIPLVSGSSSHIHAEWADRICLHIFPVCVYVCLQAVSNEFISLEEMHPNWMRHDYVTQMFSTAVLWWGGQEYKGYFFFFSQITVRWFHDPEEKCIFPGRMLLHVGGWKKPSLWAGFILSNTVLATWGFLFVVFSLHICYSLGLTSRTESKNNRKDLKLGTLKHSSEKSMAVTSMFWAKRNIKIGFRKNVFPFIVLIMFWAVWQKDGEFENILLLPIAGLWKVISNEMYCESVAIDLFLCPDFRKANLFIQRPAYL